MKFLKILSVLVFFSPSLTKAETLNEIFLETAESGELTAVQRAYSLGAEINIQRKETLWTALMLASYHSHKDIVRFLLTKGATVDTRDRMGQTALMAAVSAEKPNIEIIQMLLTYGADVNNQRKKDGWTPLMLAAKGDRPEVAKVLLDFGANPVIQNQSGETAFDIASKGEQQELITLLRPKA